MEPTFRDKQRILVCKALWLIGPIKAGDIVVVRQGEVGEYVVKRVYKTGGEEIMDVTLGPDGWDWHKGPYKVPEGTIYVLGDNLAESEDSRSFGPVWLKDVLGKVIQY